jgi:hypothetical protein
MYKEPLPSSSKLFKITHPVIHLLLDHTDETL